MTLGLDVATVTGWCLYDGYHYEMGEWDCSPQSRDEPEGLRYTRLDASLRALFQDVVVPDAVVIEEPFTMSKRGAHVLGGLLAVAQVALHGEGVDYVWVNASTLKSWAQRMGLQRREPAPGKKATLKEGMRREAVLLLDRDLTDNESDAYWLVRWLLEHNQA